MDERVFEESGADCVCLPSGALHTSVSKLVRPRQAPLMAIRSSLAFPSTAIKHASNR